MDRRRFLWLAGGLASGLLAVRPAPAKSHTLKHWAWVPTNPSRSDDEWKRRFAQARESGIAALLLEVYDGRNAYFPSTRLPVQTDVLTRLLPLARAAGLEAHAWMWSLPCMIPEILEKHPDWYNVNARGESAADKPAYVDYYRFLDPGRSEVREFVQATVKELAGVSELAGIHLDYIRHPDAILPRGLWSKYGIVQDKVYPQYDYGYSEYERSRYQKKHHVNPMKIADPEQDRHWMKFRLDMVVDLVNHYLAPAAHTLGKRITAAVFPGPTLARQMVRQDWSRFHLDAFFPMLYNAFYEEGPEWVRAQTEEGVHTVRKPVYSGLLVGNMDETALSRTVEMALSGGAAGVSLFSLEGMDDTKWAALKRIVA